MRVFISYSKEQLIKYNQVHVKDWLVKTIRNDYSCTVFDYQDTFNPEMGWAEFFKNELSKADVVIFMVGEELSLGQLSEKNTLKDLKDGRPVIYYILLSGSIPKDVGVLDLITMSGINSLGNLETTFPNVENYLSLFNWITQSTDGLPDDPFMYSYEKKIIEDYLIKCFFEKYREDSIQRKFKERYNIEKKLIGPKTQFGLPEMWPKVPKNDSIRTVTLNPIQQSVGDSRSEEDKVLASALTKLHSFDKEMRKWLINPGDGCQDFGCHKELGLSFPEAGPRKYILNHADHLDHNRYFNVGIVVSGGTAPGINAVINGIVQRHHQHFAKEDLTVVRLRITGYRYGFRTLKTGGQIKQEDKIILYDTNDTARNNIQNRTAYDRYVITSKEVDRPGSIIETGRDISLINSPDRIKLLNSIIVTLRAEGVKILYIIGGEGSMRAAHALATISKNTNSGISIAVIPKTMDNDILWCWKPFGFDSAFFKASEFINTLCFELNSNPRIGVLQLFGSYSGYVVCHAVLGSRSSVCDVAIIPEMEFSLESVMKLVDKRLKKYKKSLVVIGETVYPTDIETHYAIPDYQLSESEKQSVEKAIILYKKASANGKNPENGRKELQTLGKDCTTYSAAILKLISNYLQVNSINRLVESTAIAIAPRYLVRDIPPSPADIIYGNRLATLAVDNTMAGYTDFMISQWLTEFCLIPLKLVVLGSKRVPDHGIFWKSVIAKTDQPADLK